MKIQPPTLIKSYPWIVLLLSASFLIYKYFLQVSPSVITDQLMQVFHVEGLGLGNLAATFFYAYLITQLFVGILLDRHSLRWLSSLAIISAAIGALIFSQSHALVGAEISRAFMGFGAAFATVSYMKIASIWFQPNQFAFVGGLLATATMVGATFGEAPLAYAIDHMGWRDSFFFCGLLGFMLAVLFILIVRDSNPHADVQTQSIVQKPTVYDFLNILCNKQNWLLTFYSGLCFSPVAVFGGLWGTPFLREAYHLSLTQAASLVSLIFIGLAVGGPLLGWLSDRLHSRKPIMYIGIIISLISINFVIYYDNLTLLLLSLFLFLFGLGTGAFMLGFAIGKEINSITLAATVIALINTGDAVFGAITEPLLGKFLDLSWGGKIVNGVHYFSPLNYKLAFFLLPTYLLIALLLLYFVREKSHSHQ